MQTNTTPTLLQAIRQDPDTGLRWAMRDYAALVRGIARRILPGHDRDIEECTADVFVALWRNAARLEATGETRVTVQLSADTPEGATLQLFSADGQKLQCASSRPSADSSTVSYDFDAAPADAAGLTVKLVDKNTDPLVELAQWDVSLPTE